MVIIAVIAGDWYSKRPDKMEANPYEFSVDEFKNVPQEQILGQDLHRFEKLLDQLKAEREYAQQVLEQTLKTGMTALFDRKTTKFTETDVW